jgi:hypothetical protein
VGHYTSIGPLAPVLAPACQGFIIRHLTAENDKALPACVASLWGDQNLNTRPDIPKSALISQIISQSYLLDKLMSMWYT